MSRNSTLILLFAMLCFLCLFKAKSQINIDWNDSRREDSFMVLEIYQFKNYNLVPVFEITKNISKFFQFASDTTLDVFYSISFRSLDNEKLKISVYSSQTSEMCFSMLFLFGKMPNGIITYENTKFLINFWQNDVVAINFMNTNFNITDQKKIFNRDGRSPKYMHSEIEDERFLLVFEYTLSNNNLKLIEAKIRNVQ